MATFTPNEQRRALARLRWPLRLTRAGMVAEVLVRRFWPLLSIVLLGLAALMLGLQDIAPVELVWGAGAALAIAALGAALRGVWRLRFPTAQDAMTRLDHSLPGRPIQAMLDDPAIGTQDDAAMALWRAHKARMAARTQGAKPVPADLRVSSRDPYALRYAALLAFLVALVFGSFLRVTSVAGMAPGGSDLAGGPVWEGWAEPPRYTGKPTLYLNDLTAGALELPKGTLITLRFYGDLSALQTEESVSGRAIVADATAETQTSPSQDFTVLQDGEIIIDGPGGRAWQVAMQPDMAPEVEAIGDPQVTALGEMRLPFAAQDDYGVEAGEALMILDLAAIDRRYGLSVAPDPRPEVIVPLPTPISGDRAQFEENLIDDFSKHPWANLPIKLTLSVLDAAEQQGQSVPRDMILPGRRFFAPAAAAVIEMRRDLLWSKVNAPRIAQVLRAVSYRPNDVFRTEVSALRLRGVVRQLEVHAKYGLSDEIQDEIAEDLWGLALDLEEGVLADALDRMRRAQDRLNEAMKNGASDEEIAELMDELRRATEDYLQQLQRQQAQEQDQNQNGQEGQQQPNEGMQMTQDDLQKMMDRIQELMEEGRMAEAAEALKELQELMENMRVTEGQQGQQGQTAGEQAMEGLADTLREQQGLSDKAFRDLQEQYNPNAQAGESDGNEGRNGGQGRGQSHEGQGGRGQGEGQEQGQNGQGGEEGAPGEGDANSERSLAERQQALRDELSRQQGRLPGSGTEEGDAARDALDRAGRAMDQAEEALRGGDLAEAIDNQAQAMEALRESMRSLGEAMAQNEQNQQPGQGTTESDRRADNQDPLGREQGGNGANSSDAPLAQGPDGADRARRLLDEIRRRSGETERPELERDYLNRLLERF